MDQDEKLAEVLAEFAHTLGTDFPTQGMLDHLVQRVVDVLPVTGAGVMLMGNQDHLHVVAASNPVVMRLETLPNELDEGPCLEAYRTGEPVAIPDLGVDQGFPRFSARAVAEDLAAVFAFPMRLDEQRLGTLDLYRDTPGRLASKDMNAGQVLADVAAAYVFNAQARTDSLASIELAHHRSLHDPLTGLPNRTLLGERLEHAMARARRSRRVAAVLFVDLDGFKQVNDRFGHLVGDKVLVAVAARLREVLRPGDTLARLSGDEFVVLCEDLHVPEEAETVARRIAQTLDTPIALDGHALEMTASVGLAFSGPGEDIPETLLRDADFAMYQAKQAGGAHHQVVDHAARLAVDRGEQLQRDLAAALAGGDLQLAYQPIVAARDGGMLGVEALLRWEHPQRGWVPPDVILPIAERTGLIIPLGQWVLGQACRDLRRWQRDYGAAISQVAVNVSPHEVMAPGFAKTVAGVLAETGTDPASICLEVTESVYFDDASRALTVLQQVKDLGITLSLDDFGTGYSSLNYLSQFPFNIVKIDRSFIAALGHHPTTQAVVTAIIDLAHVLNLSVVTEGIETQEQFDRVIDLGSDQAQGYYLSRPLLPDELDEQILDLSRSTAIQLPVSTGQSIAG